MRTFGHLPDNEGLVFVDLECRHIGALLGAPSPLPGGIDHRNRLPDIPDQGHTSSCVGQAIATSVFLRAKACDAPIPRPSASAIYSIARLLDDPGKSLHDNGSRPALALRGATIYGLVTETRWPLVEANINAMPPLDVFVHGQLAKVVDYYRVPKDGAAHAVKAALSRGYFPCFAMQIDEAFESLTTFDVYQGLTGPSLGGHYQCIVGYDDEAFIVAGSWGPEFGEGGFVRVAQSFINSGAVSDILVPTIVPKEIS